MTDKEKKAIELLKQPSDFSLSYYKRENAIDTILNLIEKQSKEIEEMKKQLDLGNECEIALNSKVMDLEKEIEELKKYEKYYEEMEEVNKKFIAVDKIKAKIEEVKDGTYDAKIVLQSLLNEEE